MFTRSADHRKFTLSGDTNLLATGTLAETLYPPYCSGAFPRVVKIITTTPPQSQSIARPKR